MHIQSINLENFRCFEKLSLNLHPRLNVFFGENGAGKSAVVDSISIGLWYIIKQITGEKNSADNFKILNSDILLSKDSALVNFVLKSEKEYRISIFKRHVLSGPITKFNDSDEYAMSLREKNSSSNSCLPIFVKYHARRHCKRLSYPQNDMMPFNQSDCYRTAISYDPHLDDFFIWFKSREDLENEEIIRRVKEKKKPINDIQLEAVRNALKMFSQFTDFTVDRNQQQFKISKNGKTLYFNQLSDGEKIYILLVGDIARRLAIANPSLENPLLGEGVILIDEIELHLHPKWQRMVIPKLLETFPNCQFIATSHSPQVLGEVPAESVWILEEGEAPYHPTRSYGMESSELLREVMGAESRNKSVTDNLERIEGLIDDEKFDEARHAIKSLAKEAGNIPAIYGVNACLTMAGQDQVELED